MSTLTDCLAKYTALEGVIETGRAYRENMRAVGATSAQLAAATAAITSVRSGPPSIQDLITAAGKDADLLAQREALQAALDAAETDLAALQLVIADLQGETMAQLLNAGANVTIPL